MHATRSSETFRSHGLLLATAALVGGCAVATGAPDEAEVFPDPTPVDLASPLTAPLPDLPPPPSAEPDAFAAGVERASSGGLAFAIPAFEVRDGTALYLTVRSLVGAASGVDVAHVLGDDARCEPGDGASCSLQFERAVASHDGALNTALTPYSRLVNASATEVQVVTWTPVRDGRLLAPVTTIQGIRNGRLLGIAVFRELPTPGPTGAR